MKIKKRSAIPGIPIYVAIIICGILILTGCSGKAPESPPTEPAPSAQPTTTPIQSTPILTKPTPTPSPSPTQQTPSPEIVSATDYLKSISNDLYEMYAVFGIDEDVADYVLFIATLPTDFKGYALQNKLCIQDHKLSGLEKQFLKEPEKYLQQMFDHYMSEIGAVDPDMVTQLKKIPYFRTLETKDIEVLEDVLYLASNTQYKSTLEKLYGKGIERKMWPVALEAMVYRGMRSAKNEFEVNNPLVGSDLNTLTRLADFQAKYNKEMDEAEPVEGKKPQLVGINYVYEPMDWLKKSDEDIKFDYALMKWVLGANAVKIWGQRTFAYDVAFDHVELAHEEGLEVWLEYCPVYWLETTNPDISVEDYCDMLAQFAQEAEKAKAEVLVVGHEVDLHLKNFSSETGEIKEAVDEMVKTARQNYSGLVTYCTWSDPWGLTNVNWGLMDIFFPQLYKFDCTRELTDEEYLDALLSWKTRIPQKPLAISEFGSLTISEAAEIGPCDYLVKEREVTYDPNTQANLIDKQLEVLFKAGIYGIFFHMWDELEAISIHGWDRNKLGFGIWDYKSQEPKPAFWTVYKYYLER